MLKILISRSNVYLYDFFGLLTSVPCSKSMAEDCTLQAASDDMVMGHVDMGLNASDAHTAFSKHPLRTALSAFLDFLFMMDSAVIVRTSSSFSGTVADIKGLHCHRQVYNSLPNRNLFLRLPPDC